MKHSFKFRVRSRRALRQRRGITVLVVLLVIAMLTAVGMVATRSSQLGVVNSGRYREMTQTHYVAEAGIQGVVAEVAKNPGHWVQQLEQVNGLASGSGVRVCKDLPSASPVSTSCLKLGYQFVEEAYLREKFSVASASPSQALFLPKDGSNPGSFGNADIHGNFGVELTDPRELYPPPPGFAASTGAGGPATVRFVSVSMRAVGQIAPNTTLNDATTKYMQSVETLRAEVVFGPVPR